MTTTHFIKIGHVRFDLNRVHRYWAEGKQIEINDGMLWSLSFDTYADRDDALKIIDEAALQATQTHD